MSWRPIGRLGAWWVVAIAAASGVALVCLSFVRLGGYLLAASLVLAAMLRMTLPPARGGGLEVRSRTLDVAILLALAAGAAAAFTLVKL